MPSIRLRIVIVVLLSFSAVASGLTGHDVRGSSLEPQPGRPMRVTVSFGGLMVFQQEGKGAYAIRVAVAAEHTLKAFVDDENRGTPPISADASWFLEVTNSSPAGVSTIDVGHDIRRFPDSVVGQYDLGWMIDLNLLHNLDVPRGFTFKRGMVNPTIHLKDGVLYSNLKTEDMESKRGSGTYQPFGFFTETVGLDLEIPEGEALVLRPEGEGKVGHVLLRYLPGPQPIHQVQIKNTRDAAHDDYPSDFPLYYTLFNETISAQYDFQESSSPRDRPHNPVRRPKTVATMPGMTKTQATKMKGRTKKTAKAQFFTCCGLECNPIFLR